MIGSRAVGVLRIVSQCPANKSLLTNLQQQVRHGSSENVWNYRTAPTPPKWAQRCAYATATFCWWWFYWNMYHGWKHVIGLYDGKSSLKDPRTYTDEELGIPPDDA